MGTAAMMSPAPALSEAELKVRDAILDGEDLDFSSEPAPLRTVRASVIADACLARPGEENATVRLAGLVVQGTLDLSSRTLAYGLHWSGTQFDSALQLKGAQVQSLKFSNCELAGIQAARAHILQAIVFESGTT